MRPKRERSVVRIRRIADWARVYLLDSQCAGTQANDRRGNSTRDHFLGKRRWFAQLYSEHSHFWYIAGRCCRDTHSSFVVQVAVHTATRTVIPSPVSMTARKMMMPEPSMIADGKRSRAPSLAMVDPGTSAMSGKEGLMDGSTVRPPSFPLAHATGSVAVPASGYNQWAAPWAGQPIDSELLHALSSIAPTVLRPNLISLRPSSTAAFAASGTGANSPVLDPSASPSHAGSSSNDDEDGGLAGNGSGSNVGPKVKFVNATVEILQNQIRKEEAPKKKRTRTTPEQLRILQKAFSTDPMPNSSNRLVLAKRLGMNARAVQVWFQNRRAKEKLEAKRAEGGSMSGTPATGATSINGLLQSPSDINKGDRMSYYGVGGRSASIDGATDVLYRHHHHSHVHGHGHRPHQQHRPQFAHYSQPGLFHPNQLILPGSPTDGNHRDEDADDDGSGSPCAGLTDYFMSASGGTGAGGAADAVGGFLYNSYALEPMVSMGGELFGAPGGHEEDGDGPDNSGLGGSGGYLRFQSYPGALDGTSLGLIFDMSQPGGNGVETTNHLHSSSASSSTPSNSDTPTPSQSMPSFMYPRCNSIDVLGRMMLVSPDGGGGGGASGGLADPAPSTSAGNTGTSASPSPSPSSSSLSSPPEMAFNSSKIFCSPSSGEAFLGTGGILGASVPMPKGRSLSVPDLSLGRSSAGGGSTGPSAATAPLTEDDLITAAVGILRPTAELLSIHEEELTHAHHHDDGGDGSGPVNDERDSAGGKRSAAAPALPSATSLLSPFAAMPELLSLDADTMMNALPSWSTADL